MRKIFFYFFLLLSYTIIEHAASQSGHYWTQQYGTRSMLLSGSVIGGVEDLGAVYYNPARLSQIENPAFLISADVYEYNRLQINDAFGNNQSTAQQNIKGVPSLAAGTFTVPFLEKHHFAWAILVRGNSDLSFSYKTSVYDDVLEGFPGEEHFGGVVSISQRNIDQWTGLNWSYAFNEKFSVGVSGFLSLYNQKKGMGLNLQAYSDSVKRTATYSFNRSIGFEQYSLIGKIGISYSTHGFNMGFTVLAPKLYLRGNGDYNYEEYFSPTQYIDEDDRYTESAQSGLITNHKSPWAIGLGLTIPVYKSKVHISSEWYGGISKYTILNIQEHISQSSGDTIRVRMVDQFNSVINVGLGLEYYINDKISGYLSSSTDFSAVTSNLSRFLENTPEVNSSTFQADFYHFGGGVVLHFKRADITLGATYTGAKQEFNRPVNFPEEAGDKIFGSEDKAELEWDRARIVFSFSVPFLKDVQEKVEERLGF